MERDGERKRERERERERHLPRCLSDILVLNKPPFKYIYEVIPFKYIYEVIPFKYIYEVIIDILIPMTSVEREREREE